MKNVMFGSICIILAVLVLRASSSLTPRLGLPLLTSDGKDFTQTCSLDYPGSLPAPVFTLTWMFDSQVYKTVTLAPGVVNDTLTSSDWTGHAGQKLSCSIEEQGKPFSSQVSSFIGSLSISPSNLILREGEETVLNITSTLPIVCPHLPLVLCDMELNMDVVGGSSGDLLSVDTCRVSLKGTDWDPSTGTVSATATIASVIDPVVKLDTLYRVSYTVESNILLHPMWNNYTSERTGVILIDDPFKTCIVSGGSHIFTFNGKSFISHSDPADYLLLNATSSSGGNFQVHIRSIWDKVCELAVKHNNALLIFNACSAIQIVTQGTNRPDDLRVYTAGNEYQIITGDGIQFIAVAGSNYFDMKIVLPPMYQFSSNSICSYEGGLKTLQINDTQIFRLSPEESLLDEARPPYFVPRNSSTSTSVYCSCGQNSTCDVFARSRSPMSPNVKGNQFQLFHPHEYDPLLAPVKSIHVPSQHTRFKNLTSSMTDHQSFHHWRNQSAACQAKYYSIIPAICQSLDLDLAHIFLRECSEDLSFEFKVRGPKEIVWACEDRLFGNFSNYRQDSSGELKPLDELDSVTCPSGCYLMGKCVGGQCVCTSPFLTGSSCMVAKKTQHNSTVIIRGLSLCDKSKTRCDDVIMMTGLNNENSTVKAKVSTLEFQGGHFQPGRLIFHMDTVKEMPFIVSVSLQQILRTMPDRALTAFVITLSDGNSYTQPANYYIYDGRCQDCQPAPNEPTCYFRQDACTINNRCYQAKDINPGDKTQTCDPGRELRQWSSVN